MYVYTLYHLDVQFKVAATTTFHGETSVTDAKLRVLTMPVVQMVAQTGEAHLPWAVIEDMVAVHQWAVPQWVAIEEVARQWGLVGEVVLAAAADSLAIVVLVAHPEVPVAVDVVAVLVLCEVARWGML